MSTSDIRFSDEEQETIYDPYQIATDVITSIGTRHVRVTNYGADELTGLGLYIVAASNVGGVDNPAQNTPSKDYQDLLTWGTASASDSTSAGGMKISFDDGATWTYITRSVGAGYSSRILLPSGVDSAGVTQTGFLAASSTGKFMVGVETPSGVSTRRLFVNIVVE